MFHSSSFDSGLALPYWVSFVSPYLLTTSILKTEPHYWQGIPEQKKWTSQIKILLVHYGGPWGIRTSTDTYVFYSQIFGQKKPHSAPIAIGGSEEKNLLVRWSTSRKWYKTKKPHSNKWTGFQKSGILILSHPQKGSTICAGWLNFSVRNGKRWTQPP